MFSSQPASSRRLLRLFASAATILVAALAGAPAAHADTVTISSPPSFPTVGDDVDMTFTVTAYDDAVGVVYSEAGRTSCPASHDAADAAGMALVTERDDVMVGTPHPMALHYWPRAEGAYLFCAYTYREADTTTVRGTASYSLDVEDEEDAPIVTVPATQALSTSTSVSAEVSCTRACTLSVTGDAGTSAAMDVALGTATETIGTFGGSTSVRVPMTTAQRRDLRARMAAGETVKADLLATATFGNGTSFATSATAALRLLAVGTGTAVPVRVFTGA